MIDSNALGERIEKGIAEMERSRDWSIFSERENRTLAFLAGFHAAINILSDAKKAELGIKD